MYWLYHLFWFLYKLIPMSFATYFWLINSMPLKFIQAYVHRTWFIHFHNYVVFQYVNIFWFSDSFLCWRTLLPSLICCYECIVRSPKDCGERAWEQNFGLRTWAEAMLLGKVTSSQFPKFRCWDDSSLINRTGKCYLFYSFGIIGCFWMFDKFICKTTCGWSFLCGTI